MDNPQFSSDKSGDPVELRAEAESSEQACLELQRFLMTNPDYLTMGSRVAHPLSKRPAAEVEGE